MHFKEAVGKDDEGNELYEVEAIRDKKNEDGINLYLIKWTGWPEDTNTWEPIENLQDVLSMVEDFNKEFKKDKNKKSVFRNNFNEISSNNRPKEFKKYDEDEEILLDIKDIKKNKNTLPPFKLAQSKKDSPEKINDKSFKNLNILNNEKKLEEKQKNEIPQKNNKTLECLELKDSKAALSLKKDKEPSANDMRSVRANKELKCESKENLFKETMKESNKEAIKEPLKIKEFKKTEIIKEILQAPLKSSTIHLTKQLKESYSLDQKENKIKNDASNKKSFNQPTIKRKRVEFEENYDVSFFEKTKISEEKNEDLYDFKIVKKKKTSEFNKKIQNEDLLDILDSIDTYGLQSPPIPNDSADNDSMDEEEKNEGNAINQDEYDIKKINVDKNFISPSDQNLKKNISSNNVLKDLEEKLKKTSLEKDQSINNDAINKAFEIKNLMEASLKNEKEVSKQKNLEVSKITNKARNQEKNHHHHSKTYEHSGKKNQIVENKKDNRKNNVKPTQLDELFKNQNETPFIKNKQPSSTYEQKEVTKEQFFEKYSKNNDNFKNVNYSYQGPSNRKDFVNLNQIIMKKPVSNSCQRKFETVYDKRFEINENELFLDEEVNMLACPLFRLNYGNLKSNKPKRIKGIVYKQNINKKEYEFSDNLYVLIEWEAEKDNRDTFIPMEEILKTCPLMICEFFISHKVFEENILTNITGTKIFSIKT